MAVRRLWDKTQEIQARVGVPSGVRKATKRSPVAGLFLTRLCPQGFQSAGHLRAAQGYSVGLCRRGDRNR